MRPARLALRQLGYEQRAFWRNPAAAAFTFAFPLLLILIFGILMSRGTVASRGGIGFMYVFTPAVVGFGLIGATFTNLAMSLALQRDSGVLKRIAGTPLPRGVFISGKILSALATTGVVTLSVAGTGAAIFSVLPRASAISGLLLTMVIGAFCFASLGMAIAALIPNGESATAMVNGLMLPVVFISGIFPIDNAPTWLDTIARIFPVWHLFHALQLSYDPRLAGAGVDLANLSVMSAWGVGGLILYFRYFRWEPKK